jgi:cystathionine gamma-synthase
MMPGLKPETLLVSAGRPEGQGQPLNVPLVPASNRVLGAGPVYAREDGTPTWEALEAIMGQLEGGSATAFASGMAAVAAVLELVPGGGSIALPEECYQGVAALVAEGEAKGRWQVRHIATDDTAGWIAAAGRDDLLWLESPSNPRLLLSDLVAICAAPRKPGTLVAVDNTFATPLNQRPLALGADVSMHSFTKYIGGHSDLLGGLLIVAGNELHQAVVRSRRLHGATPGALEAWLAVRGLRTMAVRLERSQANAASLAVFLESHPAVEQVIYPGMPSHPQHALAAAQLDGFGAIISFVVRGGGEAADTVCRGIRLIHHATSLGSVETTLERRAVHAGQAHLPAGLIRISVGIEALDDLQADLDQALRQALVSA